MPDIFNLKNLKMKKKDNKEEAFDVENFYTEKKKEKKKRNSKYLFFAALTLFLYLLINKNFREFLFNIF